MSNKRSVGNFCSISVANISSGADSIAALNGSVLGQGAEAYCQQNKRTYRFDSSVAAFFSPTFVAANVGGGGWVMQNAEPYLGLCGVGTSLFTAAATGGSPTLGLSVWSEQKTGAGFYTPLTDLGNSVTIDSTTGLIIVDGTLSYRPTPFLFTMQFSVTATVPGNIWEFDITKASGGNVGNTSQSQTAAQSAVSGPGGTTSVCYTTIFTPTPSLGYEPVFRCITSGTAALYTAFYQITVTPLGMR